MAKKFSFLPNKEKSEIQVKSLSMLVNRPLNEAKPSFITKSKQPQTKINPRNIEARKYINLKGQEKNLQAERIQSFQSFDMVSSQDDLGSGRSQLRKNVETSYNHSESSLYYTEEEKVLVGVRDQQVKAEIGHSPNIFTSVSSSRHSSPQKFDR